MQADPMTDTLLERTRRLVLDAPRSITFTIMAHEIGVSVAWVSRFAADKIPNPGINHVQALYDFLSNKDA